MLSVLGLGSGRWKRRKVEAGIPAYQSLATGFAGYRGWGNRGPAAVRDFVKRPFPGRRRAMSPNQAGQGAPRRPDNLNLREEDQ